VEIASKFFDGRVCLSVFSGRKSATSYSNLVVNPSGVRPTDTYGVWAGDGALFWSDLEAMLTAAMWFGSKRDELNAQ